MGKYTKVTVQALPGTGVFLEPEDGKTPRVTCDVQVVGGPRLGEVFTCYFYLSDKSKNIAIEQLRQLGWSCNDITELDGLGSVTASGGIYTDTYDGKSMEKLAIFKPRAAVQGSAKKSFAAKFKADAVAAGVVEKTAANTALDVLPEQVAAAPLQTEDLDDIFGTEEDTPF